MFLLMPNRLRRNIFLPLKFIVDFWSTITNVQIRIWVRFQFSTEQKCENANTSFICKLKKVRNLCEKERAYLLACTSIRRGGRSG
jgi:hypothetical protein